MKKSPFYIPPGYVATPMDLVVMVFCCLLMFGLGSMMWGARVEVPPVPKEVVLCSAYVTQPLSRSKSSVYSCQSDLLKMKKTAVLILQNTVKKLTLTKTLLPNSMAHLPS